MPTEMYKTKRRDTATRNRYGPSFVYISIKVACHDNMTRGTSVYLFTWNFVMPSLMKPTICFAAAMPALVFASAVCAPIFFGVEK